MRLHPFGRGTKGDPDAVLRIKAQIRESLGLDEGVVIAVNEILCADPSCPGTETVILVMNPGQKTKAYKVPAAMAEVTPDALSAALAGGG